MPTASSQLTCLPTWPTCGLRSMSAWYPQLSALGTQLSWLFGSASFPSARRGRSSVSADDRARGGKRGGGHRTVSITDGAQPARGAVDPAITDHGPAVPRRDGGD